MADFHAILPADAGTHHEELPTAESNRIDFLRSLNILDTVAEEAFDNITRLLADTFNVPIALVSLVEDNRQWFKSVVGLDVAETARSVSFCAHMLDSEDPDVLFVPDAAQDPRFRNNILVTGEPFIRF